MGCKCPGVIDSFLYLEFECAGMSRIEATKAERDAIGQHLLSIADETDVSIVAARDWGSRARTLESESSDYDVFFVFLQSHAAYTVQSLYRDTIERTIGEEETALDGPVELHGWNMRKFVGGSDLAGNAEGLIGSNPMALEFVSSDTEYFRAPCISDDFDELLDHVAETFKPYALMRHYHSLALKNYQKYIKGDWKIVDYGELLDRAVFHDVNDDHPLEVDKEKTNVVEDEGLVYMTAVSPYTFHDEFDIDELAEDGIIEQTTTDRSIKRYLAIIQALFKRRFVEETHEIPQMDFNELCRDCAGLVPEDIYATAGDLAVRKRDGDGHRTPTPDVRGDLNAWIQSELDSDIDPEGHVERSPDVPTMHQYTENIIEKITQ